MKHLLKFNEAVDLPFGKLKRPKQLGLTAWTFIYRGLKSGYITDYEMDYTTQLRGDGCVKILYKNGTSKVLYLKYQKISKEQRRKDPEGKTFFKRYEYEELDPVINNKELYREFIKPGIKMLRADTSDTILDYEGNEHPKSEIGTLIKQSKVYQKLINDLEFFDVSTQRELKNGTIELSLNDKAYSKASRNRHFATYWYVQKTGRVTIPNMHQPSFITEPLKSLKDYDECLNYILKIEEKNLLKQVEGWKHTLIKEPEKIEKVPHRVLKHINKKLAVVKNMGIF